jgi:uncharacterized membrane protein YfcA
MTVPLIAGLIFLLAGFVQGLTGFGAALVAIPLLGFIMDIKTAVPLSMLNGLIITGYLAVALRRHLDREKILPLLMGALPGILVGVYLLKEADSSLIRYGIGMLLLAYSLYNLLAHPRPLNPAKGWGYLAGFLTGTIGAAFSAGGPPAIIYTTLTSWSKDEIKATLTGFFVINGVITAFMHAASGITTLEILEIFCFTAPFSFIGTTIGSRVSGRINRKTYLQTIYYFLILMGLMMFVT